MEAAAGAVADLGGDGTGVGAACATGFGGVAAAGIGGGGVGGDVGIDACAFTAFWPAGTSPSSILNSSPPTATVSPSLANN